MSPVRSPRTPSPTGPTGRRAAPVRTALTVLLTVLVLGGCALRLETPPPPEPSPDAVEQVRARTVDDALDLQAAAEQASTTAAGSQQAVAAVLETVAGFSARHADALGGVYDSGLDGPDGDEPVERGVEDGGPDADGPGQDPAGAPTPAGTSTAEPATPQQVLDALAAATTTARADAATVPDGPLARLVASVAAARGDLAARLAAALDVPDPTPAPAPDDAESDDNRPDDTRPDDTRPDATSPGPTSPGPTGPETTGPGATATDGTSADEAIPADDLTALVLAHDQAGYGLEVVAARLGGDARAQALSAARAHRAAADDWAARAGTADTARDPRRASYALPTGLDEPAAVTALARTLETAVADACAAALAHAPADERTPLVTGLQQATDAARRWGAEPVPFPGLPETATS